MTTPPPMEEVFDTLACTCPCRLRHEVGAGGFQRCHGGGAADTAASGAFRQAQEEQRYNLNLLTHRRLAEGQIYCEFASEEAVAVITAESPNFVAE